MRSLAIALALAGAIGCYSPKAPAGAYTCDSSDTSGNACPANLKCVCGNCVTGNGDAACSFKVTAMAPACPNHEADGCAVENGTFQVTVTAFAETTPPAGATAPDTTFSGTATIGSTWGNAHYAPFNLVNGTQTVTVSLDRATPPNTTATLTARAGDAYGEGAQALIVDPPPFAVDGKPTLDTKSGWADAAIGYPAIDAADATRTMYFTGFSKDGKINTASIGRATSPDGATWSVDAAPIITAPMTHYASPSVLHLADDDIRLFLSAVGATSISTVQVQSTDGGMTFGAPLNSLDPASCSFCDSHVGILDPWVLVEPTQKKTWLLFFSLSAKNAMMTTTSLGVGRTTDGGATWDLSTVPTPGSGVLFAGPDIAQSPRVVWDDSARLYRMYYAQLRAGVSRGGALAIVPCSYQVQYATSLDGQFWTGARIPMTGAAIAGTQLDATNRPAGAGDVAWAPSDNPYQAGAPYLGVEPGAFTISSTGGHDLWFTTQALSTTPPYPQCDPLERTCDMCTTQQCKMNCCQKIECLPFAIGHASRM